MGTPSPDPPPPLLLRQHHRWEPKAASVPILRPCLHIARVAAAVLRFVHLAAAGIPHASWRLFGSSFLPDVDVVFYFTRKPPTSAFDLRFDSEAPKVVLLQGMMAPVNSSNTLFQSPAFWRLMMLVSVSSMAADVICGYWAQRILWEKDHIQVYPFTEEKDLHENVGRLINFLNELRSNKRTLFEKILDLSYVVAEEAFWTEQDVRLTAAWL
ncbi:unnamed protein product [Urochloa humidicola]